MGTHRMDGGQLIPRIEAILIAEQKAVQALLAALEAEAAALGGRDPETLAKATADKTSALEALETLERERRDFCARIGAGPSQADMDAWLAAFADGATEMSVLRERWRSLTELLRRCRQTNQANGLVVASLQRRVQQALNLMRNGSTEPPVYGRSGSTAASPAARAIARA